MNAVLSTSTGGSRRLLRHAFRQDAVLRYSSLALLAIIALYAVPLLAGTESIDWYQGNLLALAVATWALRHRLRDVPDPAERRFWDLYSLAFASWLMAMAVRVAVPALDSTLPGLLVEDFFYLGYYVLLLFAIETHPHRVFSRAHIAAWRARRRFELKGCALFVIGLLVYYILIPLLITPGAYETNFPSGCLYLTFEILILIRAIYAYRIAVGQRWRTIYKFVILATAAVSLATTFYALTFYPGDWFFYSSMNEVPPLLDSLWYFAFFPLIWGARLRHFLPPREGLETTEESLVRERLGFPFSNILLLYASVLPILHVQYLVLGTLDMSTARQTSFTILVYIVAFAQLVHRQHRYEEGRSLLLEVERKNSKERERLVAHLEARSSEMEGFTNTIVHDLRSPIFTVKGFLGFLENNIATGDTTDARRNIRKIRDSADKMEQMLTELLELARSGRILGEPREVSLSEVAREAAARVAGRITERNVELQITADLPVVFGDRARLIQVLQNLIENAVKYMGSQNEPRIRISVRYDGGEPVYYVRDNGLGIEPEHQEEVFGTFKQLDAESDGSGLGLALVKRIIDVHGGRIWVESEGRGKGCTMCFTLPRVGGERPAAC